MPVAFVCFLVRIICRGRFRRVIALKSLLLEAEEVGDPVCPLCHQELLQGSGGVLGVCDGPVVEVEEVDGGLEGQRPGL